MRRELRAVLLDLDGTLVDSNDAHARAYVAACGAFGRIVAFQHVRPLIGQGGEKVVPEISGFAWDSSEAEALEQYKAEWFREHELPRIAVFDGARALLERFEREGLSRLLATSAGDEDVARLLRHAGLADLIDLSTSSDDADRSKPDPDIVEAALATADVEPDEALMIGDTPYDVAAARSANVPVIAFRCGGWWRDPDLDGSVAIYDGPADLLARWDESPLVRHARARE